MCFDYQESPSVAPRSLFHFGFFYFGGDGCGSAPGVLLARFPHLLMVELRSEGRPLLVTSVTAPGGEEPLQRFGRCGNTVLVFNAKDVESKAS